MNEVVLLILLASIVPLVLSIFFYVTRPSEKYRHLRVWSKAWLNPVGIQVVGQKTILVLLIGFILVVRYLGDFPARQVIAYVLYGLLVLAFWAFFVIQRIVQKPFEREARSHFKEKK